MIARSTYQGRRLGQRRLNSTKLLSFALILINAQVLLGTDNNPIGLDGAQEVFYIILLSWAIGSIWLQQVTKGSVRKLDLLVFGFVLGPIVYGTLASYVTFGQPLIYGLIEERRIMAVLIYFPIRTMLDREWTNIPGLEKMAVQAAVICAVLSLGVMLGLVPALNEVSISEISLRGERLSLGGSWIAFSIPFLFLKTPGRSDRSLILLITLLIGTLLIIVQTRQLILASLVATLFLLRGPRAAMLTMILGVSAYLAIFFLPEINEKFMNLIHAFGEIGSQAYLTQSWRGLSYNYVTNAVAQGELWGHGALSLLWQDGFRRMIGPYFYLADIGVGGTLFRYGIFGMALYFIWGGLQLRLLRNIPDRRRRTLYTGLFLFLLVGIPVGAPLEYRGHIAGFLLGITGYLANRRSARVDA